MGKKVALGFRCFPCNVTVVHKHCMLFVTISRGKEVDDDGRIGPCRVRSVNLDALMVVGVILRQFGTAPRTI